MEFLKGIAIDGSVFPQRVTHRLPSLLSALIAALSTRSKYPDHKGRFLIYSRKCQCHLAEVWLGVGLGLNLVQNPDLANAALELTLDRTISSFLLESECGNSLLAKSDNPAPLQMSRSRRLPFHLLYWRVSRRCSRS